MGIAIGHSLGIKIFIKRKDDILNLLTSIKKNGIRDKKNKHNEKICPKILDTSVIIDGRILIYAKQDLLKDL